MTKTIVLKEVVGKYAQEGAIFVVVSRRGRKKSQTANNALNTSAVVEDEVELIQIYKRKTVKAINKK